MSIKLKVVLWYALFMLVMMVAVLVFVFCAGTNLGRAQSKEKLIETVEEAVDDMFFAGKKGERKKNKNGSGEEENGKTSEQEIAFHEIETYENDTYIAVYDSDSQLVYGIIPQAIASIDTPAFSHGLLQEIAIGNDRWLFYDYMTETSQYGLLTVRGTTSIINGTDEIKPLLAAAVLIMPVLILLSVTGGYIITKRAFKPVKQINETAERIACENDLSCRIGLGKGNDEIYTLANTFDNMFDRLQEAFENEKQFTSDASHELRTPVSVIISQCEYSIENADTLSEAKEGLKVVLNQATRMSLLISRLLMLARADKGHQKLNIESFDISEIAAMVAEEKKATADKKNIKVKTNIKNSIMIDADETMIMRMLINLIDNAIDYGKEGGSIEIGVTENDAGMIVGYVADDGIGISEKDLPHIWERFYRADKSRTRSAKNGTGLGLAMVKWIVNAHGGSIEVTSKIDEGSTFIFTLPAKNS
ncbi:MAG: HAMP domain-containing histidine kinase [Clostridia bacterium]|nr:HAMP domain-containing histidine kinase [Clostridia bacterium]